MSIEINCGDIPLEIKKFPAGESLVRVDEDAILSQGSVIISLAFESNDDLINLLLVTNAIRQIDPNMFIILNLEYLPYARQDRVCNSGESLSIKVIANLINSQNYHAVECKDIHSDVGSALINNLVHQNLEKCMLFIGNFLNLQNTVLVSPDAGALKKVLGVSKQYPFAGLICASKVRDSKTGEITGTKLDSTEHIGSKDFLIVDDICDGGRTFTELAKVLRPLTNGKIYLYVTHGIFSKGMEVFDGLIDGIYVSNLMNKTHELITEI